MDRTILKNFAVDARNKLIQDIENKASMLGITKEGIDQPLPGSSLDMLAFDIKAVETYKIYGEEVKQYRKLVEELNKRAKNEDFETAYKTLIEEVAYTWFNRLIAIRFMEVNNYIPHRMRVLSSGRAGVNEPEFLTYFQDTDLDFTDEEVNQLASWRLDGSSRAMERMFQFLFVKQCNALNKNLPDLFEKTDDYAELLLTISYIDEKGVLYKLVNDIPEEYFDIESENGNGQVEIIGWLYQYYNTEPKDEVINIIGKRVVKKQDIPAATQLFTTDWVVRYMVDNSLGKYWLERKPNSSIKDSLQYLMPGEVREVAEEISPEEIKVFDNAMGSGHCLSYAFDLLLKIYESEGYTAREAARLIVEKNLYGLDIDKRAYQLAYFAIMMKVRQHNRRALNGEIKTNLAVFEDSTDINRDHLEELGLSMDKEKRQEALDQINYLIEEFDNAKEIGSILKLENIDSSLVLEFVNDASTEGQIAIGEVNIEKTQDQLRRLVGLAELLIGKYDIMVTNPPYLNKFSPRLKKYVNENYNSYKGDLFSVFIYNNLEFCKPNGYSAYMAPFVWMFIRTYRRLRKHIIDTKHISSLIQMEYSAFEEATVPICTFVVQNRRSEEKGKYIKLSDFTGGMEVQRVKTLEAIENPECGYYYETGQDNFNKIPDMPIAYWGSENMVNLFDQLDPIDQYAYLQPGLQTSNNDRFLRLWFEIDQDKMDKNSRSNEEAKEKGLKWFPYNKGGDFRRWYGNREYVVNWQDDGREIKEYVNSKYPYLKGNIDYVVKDRGYYFKESVTWSFVSSAKFGVRYSPEGSLFDVGGSSLFPNDNIKKYTVGFLNSIVAFELLQMENSTLNFQVGNIASLPLCLTEDPETKERIDRLVDDSISISKFDWDCFETSWDFKKHPLTAQGGDGESSITLEQVYREWERFTNNQFNRLKANEEEINRTFIQIYGLEDDLTPQVKDRDVTISKANKERDIKSLISYAVGCMFGRYSLDIEGLVYAGGQFNEYFRLQDEQWEIKKDQQWLKSSLNIAKDNIILITDDQYFEDDIVNRFIDFIRAVYGEETLEDNLEFIADALGGKGTAREVIRNYFIKDFYKDHVRTYQKRPIYWLYNSGRQNGFKALIYMHRYNEDTTGKLRIDYLHRLQKAYDIAVDNLKYDIANNKNQRELARAEKELAKLTRQLKECKDYDEKIAHLALARIPIDLDDGFRVNYNKVQTDEKGKNLKVLANI